MLKKYNLVVMDGFTMNPGDLSWNGIKALGSCKIYERTSREETIQRCKDADIVITNKVVFDQNTLQKLTNLKYIAVTATGYNVVDILVAKERGILVSNVPAYSTDSVAQLVFAYILNITQQVAYLNTSVHKGDWLKSKDFCYWDMPLAELKGMTLGIIGFGRIGQQVAEIARSFKMNVIVNTRTIKEGLPGIKFVNQQQLFIKSDFISLHCPLTQQTEGIINKNSIALMKDRAVLINTGRGGLVNENDLAEALNNSRIAAACLDVLSTEPPKTDNPLLLAKNCYITPHIAWATISARQRLLGIVTANIKSFIDGKAQNIVNP